MMSDDDVQWMFDKLFDYGVIGVCDMVIGCWLLCFFVRCCFDDMCVLQCEFECGKCCGLCLFKFLSGVVYGSMWCESLFEDVEVFWVLEIFEEGVQFGKVLCGKGFDLIKIYNLVLCDVYCGIFSGVGDFEVFGYLLFGLLFVDVVKVGYCIFEYVCDLLIVCSCYGILYCDIMEKVFVGDFVIELLIVEECLCQIFDMFDEKLCDEVFVMFVDVGIWFVLMYGI